MLHELFSASEKEVDFIILLKRLLKCELHVRFLDNSFVGMSIEKNKNAL